MHYQFKKAFTLAEVMVTLVMIGTIAGLTIPLVQGDVKPQVKINRLKKFYKDMNDAVWAEMDESYLPVNRWDYTVGDPTSLANILMPYLNTLKVCGTGSGCIASNKYKLLNGTEHVNYDTGNLYYKLILADGSYMWFRTETGAPGKKKCTEADGGFTDSCGVIWIDVNGKKKPNQIGVDTFLFIIRKNGVSPNQYNDCNKSAQGFGCASYVLSNENFDYLN